ncbi:hypothetical protein [Mycoplasma phocimorsus]|uniref:hypothetical protein n=1 Tax=Mycoplasma phocimorsus TaxID=3045839 RepID=UPI0024C0C0F2|nr:hypothetical protein [Mycoplasma phocimorsus]MDJ1646916.1 hypothetical protein [Mycoplasma phocimorsus]MDJ1648417.1 hypothetical protein [Mycoplasma phocimorsus]
MNSKYKKVLSAGVFSTLALVSISGALISAYTTTRTTFKIKYENIQHIIDKNLTNEYDNKVNTPLKVPKTKKGYIFVNWEEKETKIALDKIPSGWNSDIILIPYVIKEYKDFSATKQLFLLQLSNYSNKNLVDNIKKLIAEEEKAQGFNKFDLQQEIFNSITTLNNILNKGAEESVKAFKRKFSKDKLDILRDNPYNNNELFTESSNEYSQLVESIDSSFEQIKKKMQLQLDYLSTNEEFENMVSEYEQQTAKLIRNFNEKATEIRDYYVNFELSAIQNISELENEFKSNSDLIELFKKAEDSLDNISLLSKHKQLQENLKLRLNKLIFDIKSTLLFNKKSNNNHTFRSFLKVAAGFVSLITFGLISYKVSNTLIRKRREIENKENEIKDAQLEAEIERIAKSNFDKYEKSGQYLVDKRSWNLEKLKSINSVSSKQYIFDLVVEVDRNNGKSENPFSLQLKDAWNTTFNGKYADLKYDMLNTENKANDLFFVHPYWTSGEIWENNNRVNKNWDNREWINSREISLFYSLYYFDLISYNQIKNSSINIGFTEKFKPDKKIFEAKVQSNDLKLIDLIGKGWKTLPFKISNTKYNTTNTFKINIYIEEMSGNKEFDKMKLNKFREKAKEEIKKKYKKLD